MRNTSTNCENIAIMTDNQFAECNAIQEGIPCNCASCNRTRLHSMMDFNSQPQGSEIQLQAEPSSSVGPMVYARDIPQHLLVDEEENGLTAPYAPMNEAMNQDTRATPEEIDVFFGAQNIDNYFNTAPELATPFVFPNLALRPPAVNPEQRPLASSVEQEVETARDIAAGEATKQHAGTTPQPRRKGRVSKYGAAEIPRSIYGPPFQTQQITTDMSEDEIHRRIEHNASVAAARRTYLRAKNNAAAKRSRERKQRLIEQLTADVDRLQLRNEQMTATNSEHVAAVAARSHTFEVENMHLRGDLAALRAENDVLRSHVGDLVGQLDRLSLVHDAQQQQQARASTADADYPPQELVQGEGHESPGDGASSVEAASSPQDVDLGALFSFPQHPASDGDFGWKGVNQN